MPRTTKNGFIIGRAHSMLVKRVGPWCCASCGRELKFEERTNPAMRVVTCDNAKCEHAGRYFPAPPEVFELMEIE